MSSTELAAGARLSRGDFTRQRALPPPQPAGLLLDLRKNTRQDDSDRFRQVLTGAPLASGMNASSPPALALLRLVERLVYTFSAQFCPRRGWPLLATDNSTVCARDTASPLPLGTPAGLVAEARKQCQG